MSKSIGCDGVDGVLVGANGGRNGKVIGIVGGVLVISACILLSGCNKSKVVDVSMDETSNTVDFDINASEDPKFSDDASLGINTPMYEEVDGVAYEVDPSTMERIGGPLDPNTHEPLSESIVDEGAAGAEDAGDEGIAGDVDDAGGVEFINPLEEAYIGDDEEGGEDSMVSSDVGGAEGVGVGDGEDISDGEGVGGGGDVRDGEDISDSKNVRVQSSVTEVPTEYTRLPNTGKFLEDD